MPTRYVILHHTIGDCEHWDLMLEHEGVLLTWRLDREPRSPADLPIPATRIGNHRMAYLKQEGPVSGDRGHVRRVDAGTVALHELTPERCVFTLTDGCLSGQFALIHQSGAPGGLSTFVHLSALL